MTQLITRERAPIRNRGEGRAQPSPAIQRRSSQDLTRTIFFISREDLALLDQAHPTDDFIAVPVSSSGNGVRVKLSPAAKLNGVRGGLLTFGALRIDPALRSVAVGERAVRLTKKEFDLLSYLAHNSDHVVTRDDLMRNVWGFDFFGGARTVDVHVRRLRSKLHANRDAFIETLRGVGYRMRR